MSGKTIQANGLELWYESFGDLKNPAILLIMGNSCDALLWPEKFCRDLANAGHYVIRFDQRDTGLSTAFNFQETPYTLLDMAKDALCLLDALHITKAHLVGYSTGGAIAQLLAARHPARVASLTLMMTSLNVNIKNEAFLGKNMSKAELPPPKQEFIDAILALNSKKPATEAEKIAQLVQNFKLANGSKACFDDNFFYELFRASFKRQKKSTDKIGHESNHALATAATAPLSESELGNLKIATLVIAGKEDPIFPPAHGEALAKAIPGAKLQVFADLGHVLNPLFFDAIISAITAHVRGQAN